MTTKQLTLVALYGDKEPGFSRLIASCQDIASRVLDGAFMSYEIEQVHATIIGLEHSEGAARQNANFQRLRGQTVEMDIPGFLRDLSACSSIPFPVQIGGFAEQDQSFLSRGKTPYLRAFSVQGDKAVLMGWPCRIGTQGTPSSYPRALDTIRRRARRFGILHAYHASNLSCESLSEIPARELWTESF